jgi:lipopolysaccharide export system permease protein
MMAPSTLSLYVGRVFLVTIVVVFVCFLAIIYVGDLTELMRRASAHPEIAFTTVAMVALYKLPGTSEVILPFSVLFACMIAFYRLARHNELAVMRAAGISVWQFVSPACVAAAIFGVFTITLFNPLAAGTIAAYEHLESELLGGRAGGTVANVGASVWLRQSNAAGTAVVNAARGLERGTELHQVVVYQFDRGDRFLNRVSAERAFYEPGRWRLEQAWVVGRNGEPVHHPEYWVETSLSRTQVAESLGSAKAISFWDLPEFIQIAERAGLAAHEYRVQFHMLIAQPALFCAIVLVAAVFSLRQPRFRQAVRMIVAAPLLALVLFMANHASRSLGDTGALPPIIAAWWTVAFAGLASIAALFYQEDG